jgi:uncharacterized membrane protein
VQGEGCRPTAGRVRWCRPAQLPEPVNPALVKQAEVRAESVENRLADKITAFPGSIAFVYIHVIWFACWIGFGVEPYPYGLQTMIVSLEAFFRSSVVLISQSRADAKRQVIADEQWKTVQIEDRQNKKLLDLVRRKGAFPLPAVPGPPAWPARVASRD